MSPRNPIMSGRAFFFEGSGCEGKADLQLLQTRGRCLESGLIRSRYRICGAYHGSNDSSTLGDEPLVVQIAPLQGRMEAPRQFTVVPRQKARGVGFLLFRTAQCGHTVRGR